eukprot:g17621.t1
MPAVAPAGPAGQGDQFGQFLIDQGLLPPPASAVQQKETLLPPEGAEADAGPTAFFGKETALAADELAAGPGTFNLFDTMEELDYQTCIPETEEQETLKILKELLKTFIPLNVLEVSKIGIRIQEIVDKYPVDTQLHSLAKLLIQRWRNSKEDDEPDIRYAIAYYHEEVDGEGSDIKAEYVAGGVKMKTGKKDSTLPKNKTAMKNASTAPMKKVSAKAAAARDLFGLNEEAEEEDEQEDFERLFAAGEDVEEEARNKKDQKQLRRHKTDDGDEDEDDDFLAPLYLPGGTTKKTDEKTRKQKAAAATGASMLKPRARKATSKAAQETDVIGDEPAAAVPSPAAKQDKKKVVKGGMKKAAAEKKENAAPAMKSSKAAGAAAGGKKMNKKSAGAEVFGASPGEPAQEQYGAAGVASSGGKKSAQAQIAVKAMKTARSKPGAGIGDHDQQQHEPNASVVETGTAGGDTTGTADAARPAAKKMNVMKSMKSLDVAAPAAPAEGAAPVATAQTAVVGEDAKAKDHEPAPARGMKTSKAPAGGAAKSTAMKMKKAEKKGQAADVLAQPKIAAAADDDVEMEIADDVAGGADVQQLLAEASSSSPADGKMKKAPGGPMKRKPKARVAPAASNPVDADDLRDNTIDEQQTAAAILGAAPSSAATGRADEEVVGTANKMKAPAMKRKQEALAAVQAAGGESLNLIEKPCEEEDAVAPMPAKKAKMAAKRKADKVAEQPPVAASNPNQKEAAVVELPGAAAAEEKSAAEQSAPAMKKMSMKATPPAVNGAAVEEVKVDTANDTGLAAMKKRGRPAASKNMKTAEAAATSSSALEQLDAKDEAGAAASSSKASVPAVDTHHQQPQHNSGPDAHHLYHDRSNGLSSGGAGGGGGAHHYAYNQHHHGTSSAGLGMVNQTFIDCTTAIPEDLYKRLEYEANIDRGVHVPKKKSNGECVLMHTGVY